MMRHAKAEPFASEDRLRQLTGRGRAAALDVGHWCAERCLKPDHALVSPATRTRQTWAAFAEGLGTGVEPTNDAALYSAGVDTAMECLRSLPENARCVVFVGHNPTVATLVHLLGDGAGDAAAFRLVSSGYPPSAAAVFTVPSAWADLDIGTARLEAAYVGKG